MIHVTVLCVGKLKEKFYHEACAEYCKRLGAFCKITVTELKEERLPDEPNEAQIEAALSKEAEQIEKQIPEGSAMIAMCIEGKQMDSAALSRTLDRLAVTGGSKLCFVIGGSCGLHERIKNAAALRLSMSEMTFPHHLARIMLLEQLYRSFQIARGGKYHK